MGAWHIPWERGRTLEVQLSEVKGLLSAAKKAYQYWLEALSLYL